MFWSNDGQGEEAVYDFVEKQARRSNGYMALQKARQRFNPITYQEMLDITNIWVEAALRLTEKDLKVMDRFVRSQQKLYGNMKLLERAVEAGIQTFQATA